MLTILHKSDGLFIAQTYDNSQSQTDTQTNIATNLRSDFGFNLGLHVYDKPQAVLYNRAYLLDYLNKHDDIHQIAWLNQVHSNRVHTVDRLGLALADADALITDKPKLALAIMTADCVPIAIWGQINDKPRMIGCVHAGWQGLTTGVIKNSVYRLKQYHHQAQIFACIGACIGVNSYEVDRVLANQVIESCLDNQLVAIDKDSLYQRVVVNKSDTKAYLNIGGLAALQLQSLGVEIINKQYDCTYTGHYYSHRRATHQAQQNKMARTGRMAMVIALT